MNQEFQKLASLPVHQPHPTDDPTAELPDKVLAVAQNARRPCLSAGIERLPLVVRHRFRRPDGRRYSGVIELEQSLLVGRKSRSSGKRLGRLPTKCRLEKECRPFPVPSKPVFRGRLGPQTLARCIENPPPAAGQERFVAS